MRLDKVEAGLFGQGERFGYGEDTNLFSGITNYTQFRCANLAINSQSGRILLASGPLALHFVMQHLYQGCYRHSIVFTIVSTGPNGEALLLLFSVPYYDGVGDHFFVGQMDTGAEAVTSPLRDQGYRAS